MRANRPKVGAQAVLHGGNGNSRVANMGCHVCYGVPTPKNADNFR